MAVSGPEMAIFWSDKNVNDAIGSSVSVEVSRLEILFSTICIKLASPQAAWLSIFFIENQLCCTSVRELIKVALLIG